MQNLTNKTIVITGASSGIGEATATLLASHGAYVVLGARRADRLAALVETIRAQGGQADYRETDVTDAASVTALVQFAREKYGRIDVLFNNAGIMPLSRLNELQTDQWNAMIDINIKGVLNGIAAALPLMEAQGNGHILNTTSIGSHHVIATGAVYCATKYAVWAITEGLRQETTTVRVTSISPGVTTTELGHDIRDAGTQGMIRQFRQNALPASAIADAVFYAVSQPEGVDVNEVIVRATSSTY